MKFGVVPDFTAFPSPKPIAHAAKSELRYFSIWPLTSQEVLKTSVANSCPLPSSAASFSVFRRGLAKVVLSLLSRQMFATVLAVAISGCLAFPNPISFSRMLAGMSLVSNLGETHRNLEIINPLLVGLPPDRRNLHRMTGWVDRGVDQRLSRAGGNALRDQPKQAVITGGRVVFKLFPGAEKDRELMLPDLKATEAA